MKTNLWVLDPTHSEIQFKVKHLMISTVTGQFNSFSANIESAKDDFSDAKVKFTADISSISTNNEQRDNHLKTGDFFDAENHPKLTFTGEKLEKISEDNYKVHGTLTMRGVSKPEKFDVEFGGITTDPWGNTRTGFSLSGKILRSNYGITFGTVSETGGVMLSDEIKIFANAQFVKQAEAIAA
jgi:polyisoprenoid-binding protein YceI